MEPIQIGERVRQVHLDHFCPGGAGLPVTTSRPVGLDPEDAAPTVGDGGAARAAGQRCGRCGRPITPTQDARRRVTGIWVHENCPA